MRIKNLFNDGWKFHYGEIGMPPKNVRKAAAIGGFTSVIEDEKGDVVPLREGGHHFLNLISGGNEKFGLVILAGTKFDCDLSGWKDVSIPHDWKRELPYIQDPRLLMSGSKPDGVGYYRKVFSIGDELKGKQISVSFDGVMRCASVWFNGCFLGDHYSGYTSFSYDLTDIIHYGDEGDNVLLVRVDTTMGTEGWWYDGAGIYRNVYLETTEKIHVAENGVHAFVQELQEGRALISIDSEIKNDSYNDEEISLNLTVYNDDKVVAKENTVVISIPSIETKSIKRNLVIDNPKLWCIKTPNLYSVVVEVICQGKVIDVYNTIFGIREIKYTTEGLFINGNFTEIKGVCEHQDFGGVGTALSKDIVKYKLMRLKEMGVNAYRCAHHAASVELLDLCDEMGIMVMEENRILESSKIRVDDVESMVKRDRNHPSIIFWSISNEEVIGSTEMAERMARRIANKIRKLDTKRLIVSAELLNPEGILNPDYIEIFDVLGVNYPESAVMGPALENIKKRYPNKPIMSTENASYFSTRGIYKDNWDKCQTSNYRSHFSMFGSEPLPLDSPGAGGTAYPEKVMDFYEEHKFMGGSFIWTAFDYYGEPAPFSWPAISSQFGVMDLCGFPKDYYYYYKSKWCNESMVYAMAHWNWNDGDNVEVRVFSNCEEVELIVNNLSFGKEKCGKHSTSWNVTFEPGELKVIGYKSGEAVVEDIKKTADEVVSLGIRRIDSDDSKISNDETMILEVYALDKNGVEVPTANNLVKVEIKGSGDLLGISNGDPSDHTLNGISERRLFSGKLALIVKSTAKEGEISVLVNSDGLVDSEYKINISI